MTNNTSSLCAPASNNSLQNSSGGCSNSNFKYYFEYEEFRTYQLVSEYTPYVIYAPSVLFNLLCIIVVFRMKPFNSACIFMFVLGWTDLLCVIFRLLFIYVDRHKYDWVCRLLTYMSNNFMVYSNFVLVCFTLERLIVTVFPLKASQICTNKNTKISLSVSLILCLALNLPYLTESFVADRLKNGVVTPICTLSDFLGNKWVKVLGVYHNFVPIAIVALSNVVIIYKLKKRDLKKKEMMSRRIKDQKSPTQTLVVVSIVFLVLHLPYVLFNIFAPEFPTPAELPFFDQHRMATLLLIGSILYRFMACQNGVNFFLYCLTAENFRLVIRGMVSSLLGRIAKSKAPTTSSASTVTTNLTLTSISSN